MHKVCYLLLGLSLWCCPFSALSAPSNDNKTAQITANQLTYQQIFELQNRLAQLEAELRQQQNTKADLKDAEKDLLELKLQLSELKVLVESDDKNQDRRLNDFTNRISDTQNTMNGWLTGLTFLLVLVGYLAYRQSKQEAKQLAQQQMETFIAENKPKLLTTAQEELATTKQGLEAEIEVLRKQVSLSQDELKQHVEDIRKLKELVQSQADDLLNKVEQTQKILSSDNATIKVDELTEQQKRQLNLVTQLKPESEFTTEDWYNRSSAQLANEDFSGALASIEIALQSQTTSSNVEIAKYLVRKSLCFWHLKDDESEIETHNLLIDTFINSPHSAVQQYVAMALFNKGSRLSKLQRNFEGIACYDLLSQKYHQNTDIRLKRLVAKALNNKAFLLGEEKKSEEQIATYDLLLEKFNNSNDEEILEQVAKALVSKGITLAHRGKPSDAIAIYDLMLERFKDVNSKLIRPLVALTLYHKGSAFGSLNKNEEKIATFDQLISAFIDNDDIAVQRVVAQTIHNKGFLLGQMHKAREAIFTYEILLRTYANRDDPEIQQVVVAAYANLPESALSVESPAQVLNRVSQCETMTDDPQHLAAMQFVRFILDDKPVKAVLESIRQMPSNFKLTWQFAEIKPYIEANISGEKLQQCHAIIAFFEQHKDVNRLAKELGLN